jgi:hypothetical protein
MINQKTKTIMKTKTQIKQDLRLAKSLSKSLLKEIENPGSVFAANCFPCLRKTAEESYIEQINKIALLNISLVKLNKQ